jgi:hypothetical protein
MPTIPLRISFVRLGTAEVTERILGRQAPVPYGHSPWTDIGGFELQLRERVLMDASQYGARWLGVMGGEPDWMAEI